MVVEITGKDKEYVTIRFDRRTLTNWLGLLSRIGRGMPWDANSEVAAFATALYKRLKRTV